MLMLSVRFFLIDSLSFSASGIGLFRRLLVVSRVRVVRVVFFREVRIQLGVLEVMEFQFLLEVVVG